MTSASQDGCVHSPFLRVSTDALIRQKSWIRIPAFAFVGSSVTKMLDDFAQTFLAFDLPSIVAPVLLALRLRAVDPFAATRGGNSAKSA